MTTLRPVEHDRKVSARLVKGVGSLMKGNAVTVFEGVGRLRSATEVEVTAADGAKQVLRADAIILATGARARMIPGVEIDGERVLTYREALSRRTLPKSAVVIGAGPIGLEFATIWSSYGADVRVVEMLDHVLPAEDEEAANELGRYLRRQKIKLLVSTRGQSITATDAGVRVSVARTRWWRGP